MSHELSRQAAGAISAFDPLDVDLQRVGMARPGGWSRVSSHTALLLLTGMALGPQGLTVLTPALLELLEPAVPVALALVGVTAVLGSVAHSTVSRRPPVLSSLLIVGVGLNLALQDDGVTGLIAVTQAAAIAILLAGAGWILCAPGSSVDERRVFSIATVLLLGGVADYRSVSGLLLGWVAAGTWRLAGTTDLDGIRRDVAYVEHPIMALLLVTAGAHVIFSWQVAMIAGIAAVILFLAVRLLRDRPIARLGGVPFATFAVALAMDASRLDPRLTIVLSVIALNAVMFDLFLRAASEGPA
jgi:hypothetical protein